VAEPVIVVGDFNMDCSASGGPESCDAAHRAFSQGLTWVPSTKLHDTTCAASVDDMLDLVFVGGDAVDWDVSTFTLRDEAFCGKMESGAHFPIVVDLEPSAQQITERSAPGQLPGPSSRW
jgi:hypothetical protein